MDGEYRVSAVEITYADSPEDAACEVARRVADGRIRLKVEGLSPESGDIVGLYYFTVEAKRTYHATDLVAPTARALDTD